MGTGTQAHLVRFLGHLSGLGLFLEHTYSMTWSEVQAQLLINRSKRFSLAGRKLNPIVDPLFGWKNVCRMYWRSHKKNKNPYTPCKPETISITSSYTMRVAALSGRRSRLMEENTGTQTNTKSTRVRCIERPSISSRQDEKLPGPFTDHYQTKQVDKASLHMFNRLVSSCPLRRTKVGLVSCTPFLFLSSILSLLHCSELVSVLIQLAAVLLAHNSCPTLPKSPRLPPPPPASKLQHTHTAESAAASWVVLGVEEGFSVEGKFK